PTSVAGVAAVAAVVRRLRGADLRRRAGRRVRRRLARDRRWHAAHVRHALRGAAADEAEILAARSRRALHQLARARLGADRVEVRVEPAGAAAGAIRVVLARGADAAVDAVRRRREDAGAVGVRVARLAARAAAARLREAEQPGLALLVDRARIV